MIFHKNMLLMLLCSKCFLVILNELIPGFDIFSVLNSNTMNSNS